MQAVAGNTITLSLPARRSAPRSQPVAASAPFRQASAGLSAKAVLGGPQRAALPSSSAAARAQRLQTRAVNSAPAPSSPQPPVNEADLVKIDPVVGAKRFSNYFWASVITTGATGFLITGLSAYIGHNILFFLDASEIQFFPQGLVLCFYGVAGLTLALYNWLTIAWDVGSGYNEFNKKAGIVRIFRYGFPGKNRRIDLVSPLKDVRAVRVEVKEGVNPRRVLYVCIKGRQDIPLTRIGQPLTLAELEGQAADLAKFLQVPIEGL